MHLTRNGRAALQPMQDLVKRRGVPASPDERRNIPQVSLTKPFADLMRY